MELSISRASFRTWFQKTQLLENDDGRIRIGVQNIFTKKQLEDKYDAQIREVLERSGVAIQSIEYTIQPMSEQIKKPSTGQTGDLLSQPQAHTVVTKSRSIADQPMTAGKMNPKYEFENFIVGSSNDLAYAAAQAIAQNPGQKYNPFFVYGGSGLGKTHLIQAIGNEVLKQNPNYRIVYATCEQFVSEFLDHIRYKRKGFSEKYRSADMLIVDDIQFIAGKERTEEQFFHTFNDLHQSNKQIILSSDKAPRSIPTLEERLRTRFEWGMTVDVQPPDFEMRSAILQSKAHTHHLELPSETVEYMANHIQTNIRELEGYLNQLIAFCELKNLEPTLDVCIALLGDGRSIQPKRITPKQIVDKTARHFNLALDDITGPKRDKDIVVPRQIAMYLLRSELHISFPRVAKELGRKDHTTAMHSVDKIQRAVTLDNIIRQHINDIKDQLYGVGGKRETEWQM